MTREGRSRLWPMAGVAVVSLFVYLYTFRVIIGKGAFDGVFLEMFLFNLPFALLAGYIDWVIVSLRYRGACRHGGWRFVGDCVLATGATALLATGLAWLLRQYHSYPWVDYAVPTMLWNLQLFLFIRVYVRSHWQLEMEKRLARLQEENARYQFEALKQRLNPHFLFNCLNVLAALAYQDAAKANLFAKRLSDVYRYLLAMQHQNTVSLAEELAFVDDYLYLMRLRFDNNLHTDISPGGPAEAARRLIPCSVQMLIENALKHNVCNREKPLRVRVVVGEKGVTVENDLQPRVVSGKSRFGLKNLREQYAHYGLSIGVEATEGTFRVSVPFIGTLPA